MGLLEPLTAFGLGRSPYDAVVYAPGPPHRSLNYPHDSRGHPTNPESRDRSRRIIRSHNEVMHVIGVAEPDGGENDEMKIQSQFVAYETAMGYRMHHVGAVMLEGGMWSVGGIRNRVMVWRAYGALGLRELIMGGGLQGRNRLVKLFLAGIPTNIALKLLKYNLVMPRGMSYSWIVATWTWLSLHSHIWILFQRVGAISPYWLPHPLFFVPWSSYSPICPPPALPTEFTVTSLAKWACSALLTVAPALSYAIWVHCEASIHGVFNQYFMSLLPVPDNSGLDSPVDIVTGAPIRRPETPQQDPPNQVDSNPDEREEATDENPDDPGPFNTANDDVFAGSILQSIEVEVVDISDPPDNTPHTPLRRASTPSPSSPDDSDSPGAPVISFDLDTSPPPANSGPGPAGTWSAELRPTSVPPSDGPTVYLTTLLALEPQYLASEIIANLASHVAFAGLELFAVRFLVRNYLTAHPFLPAAALMSSIGGLAFWRDTPLRTLWNIVGLELAHTAVMGDLWSGLALMGRGLHYSQSEWRELTAEKRAQLASLVRREGF